jgi:hypothetical protein
MTHWWRHTDSVVAESVALSSRNAVERPARDLLDVGSSDSSLPYTKDTPMKYGLAWLLGIPIPILAVVYLVSHC